jgi:ArsR family transcriptional regulator
MTEERLAQIGKALGHPARIRILEQFEEHRCHMVQEIVGECTLAQSTVSEHLRILREAGVLFARQDGPRVWYCLRRSLLEAYASAIGELVERPDLLTHR